MVQPYPVENHREDSEENPPEDSDDSFDFDSSNGGDPKSDLNFYARK